MLSYHGDCLALSKCVALYLPSLQGFDLVSCILLQVLSQKPATGNSSKPPLVFIHGSYHAAWCVFDPIISPDNESCDWGVPEVVTYVVVGVVYLSTSGQHNLTTSFSHLSNI